MPSIAAVQGIETTVVSAFDEDGDSVDHEAELTFSILCEDVGSIELNGPDTEPAYVPVDNGPLVIQQGYGGFIQRLFAISARPPKRDMIEHNIPLRF